MGIKIIRLLLLIGLLLALCNPVAIGAAGVAMAPMTMEIRDAQRGAELERMVTVFNPSKSADNYIIRVEGQAASWLSFYGFENKQVIQNFTIPGESNINVIVRVNIPSDIDNGDYEATIYSETAPSTIGGDNGISAILQASTVLTIKVTGTQIQDGIVGSITTHDTEVGIPLQLEIFFSNTGNVILQPKIDCQIIKENNTIDSFSYADTIVKPGSQATIPVIWASPIDQLGEFVAKVTVSIGAKTLTTQDVNFKIVPAGTLTQQGELDSLNYEGQPLLGNMLKIQAKFKNTGEANTLAKSVAEVYLDGNFIDTNNSEVTLVPIGQTGTLISYLKPTKTGAYTIKVFVTYAGKQTATKEITFTTSGELANPAGGEATNSAGSKVTNSAGGNETSQPSGLSIIILVAVIGAIAVIGIITMLLVRKRRVAK